jgi:NUMOD3 motif
MDMKKAKGQFNCQKDNAKQRGIEFHLTFEEWVKIWAESGHYEERGRGANKYVMSRFGDVGPYAVGNVFIQTGRQNSREIHDWLPPFKEHSEETKAKLREIAKTRPPASVETRAKISAAGKLRAPISEETRAKLSAWQIGRKHSDETKEKIRAAHAKRKLNKEKQLNG